MNRRRLEHTARMVLPFVEPENIYMPSWFQCKTNACAFGHECRSGFGKLEGLRLHYGVPAFAGQHEFAAVGAYYEIDDETARWIFHPWNYDSDEVSPSAVAERIESLLASESP